MQINIPFKILYWNIEFLFENIDKYQQILKLSIYF